MSRAHKASLGELSSVLAPLEATSLGTAEAAVRACCLRSRCQALSAPPQITTLPASRAMSLFGSQPGSLLVEPLGKGGACLLFSPLPDAFGKGATRTWVRTLATKLQALS